MKIPQKRIHDVLQHIILESCLKMVCRAELWRADECWCYSRHLGATVPSATITDMRVVIYEDKDNIPRSN